MSYVCVDGVLDSVQYSVRVSTFITVPQFGTVVMRLATISKGRWVGGARTYSIWACALRSAACGVSSLIRGPFAVHGEVLSEVPTWFQRAPSWPYCFSSVCVFVMVFYGL